MPPPAVCVLAILGTVGAALVFKQFVYDPHLSHVVRRWKEDLRQWRRRPMDIQHGDSDSDEPDVPMQERERSSRIGQPDGEAISSSWEVKGTRFSDGLLSHRRLRNSLQDENMTLSSFELDNLVARELSEWRNEMTTSSGQDLRQNPIFNNLSAQDAHNGGHHPLELEEDTKSLPYVPLSPRRTHVLCNSGSTSPATPAFDAKDLPSLPLTTTSTGLHDLPSPPQTATPSPLIGPPSPRGSMTESQHLVLLRGSLMQNQPSEIHVFSNLDRKPQDHANSSHRPIGSVSNGPPLPLPSTNSLSRLHISSPAAHHSPTQSQEQEQNSPSPFLLRLPPVLSLSQSYPQELEIEHGLELLSPPSSRSDSPFSMANISPRPPALPHQEPDRTFHHPTSPLSFGDSPSEAFSPAIPLEMGLGNQSFNTLSPAVGPKQLALREGALLTSGSGMYLAPSLASQSPEYSAGSPSSTPLSGRGSLKSSAYLSFAESEDDDDVPLATRRSSLILATSNSPRNNNQGLGLTFVPPSPGNPPAPLSPSILSPRSRLAEVSTNYGVRRRPIGSQSDSSELSDLDLMSDYSAASELEEAVLFPWGMNGGEGSESRGGNLNPGQRPGLSNNEGGDRGSDASWSIAGGSDFGDDDDVPQPQTPQLRPVGRIR